MRGDRGGNTLVLRATALDAAGQRDVRTLTVNIEDDSPILGTPNNAYIAQTAGAVAQGNLQLALGADNGATAKVHAGDRGSSI